MTDEKRQQIRDILTSTAFTESEKFIVKWQFGLLGDFRQALINAIKLADEDNLARLANGFPDEVAAFIQWSAGDLANRLRETGLEI